MAEEKNVRLVRCPKCDNLQPELKAFSANRCGGCGVALRGNAHFFHSQISKIKFFIFALLYSYFFGTMSPCLFGCQESEKGNLENFYCSVNPTVVLQVQDFVYYVCVVVVVDFIYLFFFQIYYEQL